MRLTDQLRETNERLSAVRMQLESRGMFALFIYNLKFLIGFKTQFPCQESVTSELV